VSHSCLFSLSVNSGFIFKNWLYNLSKERINLCLGNVLVYSGIHGHDVGVKTKTIIVVFFVIIISTNNNNNMIMINTGVKYFLQFLGIFDIDVYIELNCNL